MENIISQGQKILINGKETVDPLMIGYSILDAIENGFELRLVKESFFQNTKSERKKIINEIIVNPEKRRTEARDFMIELICSIDEFNTNDFILKAEENNISKATAYNFINLLVKNNIIKKTNNFTLK